MIDMIDNETDFRDDHLEAFVARLIPCHDPEKLHPYITFSYDKGERLCGMATEGDSFVIIYLPRRGPVDRVELAHTIAHEWAHADLEMGHEAMEDDPRYDNLADGWRSLYSWANDLPLEREVVDFPANPLHFVKFCAMRQFDEFEKKEGEVVNPAHQLAPRPRTSTKPARLTPERDKTGS